MNIFQKYTARSLMKNKSRTIVTIIGILLSTAMVTAVIQAANSGLEYLKRVEIEENGAYHALFRNIDAPGINALLQTGLAEDMTVWQEVGWALIGSTNEDKPFLLIESVPDDLEKFVAVHLLSGRLPENDSEIVLPKHLSYNGGVDFEIGDELTVEVGTRTPLDQYFPLTMANGYVKEEETLVNCTTHTYTVVGVYDRFSYEIEPYSCPGYTALTKGAAEGPRTLFVTFQKVQEIYDQVDSGSLSPLRDKFVAHSDLIRLSGSFRNGNLVSLLYGFVMILVLLIGFGSVMLIYNSFSISVSERTKQFGILKSIGATRKQIRQSVLFEGFLLCLVGIPLGILSGCIGIGITLWCLRNNFTFLMGSTVEMKLVVSPIGLVLTVIISLVITLISAWIPARRAIRISAIDSIRLSQDIKLRGRKLRTSPLTKKLFGFEGMMASKNFKRNKKRYRSTIVSLFLSIVLFISTSAFCAYLTRSVEGIMSSDSNEDLSYYIAGDEGIRPDAEEVFQILSAAQGVDSVYQYDENRNSFRIDPELIHEDHHSKNDAFGETNALSEYYLSYVFLDDAGFRTLCAQNHLSPERYMDREHPQGLLFNREVTMEVDENNNAKWKTYSLLQEDSLPCEVVRVQTKEIEGFTSYGPEITEDGRQMVVYYPNEYMLSYHRGEIDTLDRTMATLYPADEVEEKTSFPIGALIETPPTGFSTNSPMLFYPDCCRESVIGDEYSYVINYSIRAQNHEAAYNNIKNALQEHGLDTSRLHNHAADRESERMLVTVIRVFSYGFIVLISMIAIANVFNTISTNIALRRREFAMLRSVGLTEGSLQKMMNYECLIYGLKSLLYGLPISFGMTYLIWNATTDAVELHFFLPWPSIGIAVGSVFAVIFITMLYSIRKIRRDNPIDALKNENL
ncbi:MAG: ABC transporter permease [Acetatifactor sp.]